MPWGGGIGKITYPMYLTKSLSLLAKYLHLSSLSFEFFKFIVILVIGWRHRHQFADVSKISPKIDYFFLRIPSNVNWSKFIITLLILFETKDRPKVNLGKYQCNVMLHIFVSLNFSSDCKISIAAEPIELYGKHWFSLLSPSLI